MPSARKYPDPAMAFARTCLSCQNMFKDVADYRQASTEEGLTITTTKSVFFSSVQEGCVICCTMLEEITDTDQQDNPQLELKTLVIVEDLSVLVGHDRSVTIQLEALHEDDSDPRNWLVNRFQVSTLAGDPAAKYISCRPIRCEVASDECFGTAREWIENCLDSHMDCPEVEATPLPTRVIDVGDEVEGDADFARVRTTGGIEAPYAALSYCWGGPQPVMLSSRTFSELHSRFKVSLLPATLRDAIMTTRKLGLQFLCIDALCIIQDSDIDKSFEISRMDSIYQNSYVTICASIASRCQDGFLSPRVGTPESPLRSYAAIRFPCPNGSAGQVYLTASQHYFPEDEPLNKRAWAFQEALLSPRVLKFGLYQMYWECSMIRVCDGGSVDWGGRRRADSLDAAILEKRQVSQAEEPEVVGQIYEAWRDVVEDYSRRGLTDRADTFLALSGIARLYQRTLNDTYCAGLWGKDLLRGLAWRVANGQDGAQRQRCRQRAVYRAPSWSWGSMDVAIRYFLNHEAAQATQIIDCKIDLVLPSAPCGAAKGGTITIRGPTKTRLWDGSHEVKGLGDSTFLIIPDVVDEMVEGETYPFYMGEDAARKNGTKRMRIKLLLLTSRYALVLRENKEGRFERLGIMDEPNADTKDGKRGGRMSDLFLNGVIETIVIE